MDENRKFQEGGDSKIVFFDVSNSYKSFIWKYFKNNKIEGKVKCNICHVVMKHDSGSNTTDKRYHLKIHHNINDPDNENQKTNENEDKTQHSMEKKGLSLMSEKGPNKFSVKFKLKIISEAKKSSNVKVAKAYGIDRNVIGKWRKNEAALLLEMHNKSRLQLLSEKKFQKMKSKPNKKEFRSYATISKNPNLLKKENEERKGKQIAEQYEKARDETDIPEKKLPHQLGIANFVEVSKKVKQRNEVWQYFKQDPKTKKSLCSFCHEIFAPSKNGGSKIIVRKDRMINHLKIKHKINLQADNLEGLDDFLDVSSTSKSKVWKYFKEHSVTKMARCNECGKIISGKHGTSTLIKHLFRKHKLIAKNTPFWKTKRSFSMKKENYKELAENQIDVENFVKVNAADEDEVWKNFKQDFYVQKAKCDKCEEIIDYKHGTKEMITHLRLKHSINEFGQSSDFKTESDFNQITTAENQIDLTENLEGRNQIDLMENSKINQNFQDEKLSTEHLSAILETHSELVELLNQDPDVQRGLIAKQKIESALKFYLKMSETNEKTIVKEEENTSIELNITAATPFINQIKSELIEDNVALTKNMKVELPDVKEEKNTAEAEIDDDSKNEDWMDEWSKPKPIKIRKKIQIA